MKKTLLTAIAAAIAVTGAQAYQFQLDITPGDTVTVDGTNPFTGEVYIGYFDAGTNFANPFSDLDSNFNPIHTGGFGAGGQEISLAIPAGGSWANNTLNWNATTPDQDGTPNAGWDSSFSGEDLIAVFTNLSAPTADGDAFDGATTMPTTAWDSVTDYLVVNTANTFKNAVGSDLAESFATVDDTDTVLKASGSAQVIPEPSAALLILAGLGFQLLRRRRA